MKKLFLAFTFMSLSLTSLASNICSVAQDTNGDGNFQDTVLVKSLSEMKDGIDVIINPDGTVNNDIDLANIFDGLDTVEQIENKIKVLAGSKIAMIRVDGDQITLSSGIVQNNMENMLKSNAMVIGDIDSKKTILFDMQTNVSISCMSLDQ